MIEVFLNDARVECREGTTVGELLAQEGIAPVNVAVAVDDTVVPKSRWAETAVAAGARVLVIRAVQGG